MNEIALKALQESIEVWQEKLTLNRDEMEFGLSACPLCRIFVLRMNTNSAKKACNGCPIKERTGKPSCINTPYQKVCNLHDNMSTSREQLLKAIQEEINFLKSLLPK